MSLGKLCAFAAVVVCQFVLFEGALRLHGGSEAAPAFQRLFMTDDRIGYRLKPGMRTRYTTSAFETDIAINSSGTRDEEIGPKRPDERRIVVLGDSLVLAVQVPLEQTFCKRLEERLNRDPALAPYHYRVINAGVQGYGPVEDWLFYEHVVSRFDADVVLVALFVGNDAIEAADQAWRLDEQRATGVAGVSKTIAAGFGARIRRAMKASMVLQIVRMRLLVASQRLGLRSVANPAFERPLTAYLATPPDDVVRGLEVTRDCVSRIAAFAAARHARTGVVLVPARFQVNDVDFANLQIPFAGRGEPLVRNAATERFRTALAGLPAPVDDLLPPMFEAPRRSELFFEDTIHLTPRGHDVVAAALERFLLDSRLLDRTASSAVANVGR